MTRKPKLMPLAEAVAEGRRWLASLDQQAARSKRLAEIAAARRDGSMDEGEARREVAKIDRRMGVTVYDGAQLAEAVKAFIALAERQS